MEHGIKRREGLLMIAAAIVAATLTASVAFIYYSPEYSWSASVRDHDGDGHADRYDVFPDNSSEWEDTDGDTYGDNCDFFPSDSMEWIDSDGDGCGDNGDEFPDDPEEWADSDRDGYGDNADDFPYDEDEWNDADGDGVGDNADAFPDEPSQSQDTDGDGYGDSSSGVSPDAFPYDPTEWSDADGDGVGDNSDEFPHDPEEWLDSDGDGIGDNADTSPNSPPAITIVSRTITSYPNGYRFQLSDPSYELTWTNLTIILQSGVNSATWSTASQSSLTGSGVQTQALGAQTLGSTSFYVNATDLAGNGYVNIGDYFTITGTFVPAVTYTVYLVHEPTGGQMASMTWTT